MAGIPKTPLMPNHIISVVHQESAAEKHGLQRRRSNYINQSKKKLDHNVQKIQPIIQPLALKEATIVIERRWRHKLPKQL